MTVVLYILSGLLFIATFLTQVRSDYWVYRILEYPRLQKLFLIVCTLILWFTRFPLQHTTDIVFFSLLCIAAIYLLYKIWPYTVFFPKEMKRIIPIDEKRKLTIFAANVYQDNDQYHLLIKQIRSTNPDIIFLLETHNAWDQATKELDQDYPYGLKAPLENTYGLIFKSRIPLEDGKINFLVKNDIPSVETTLLLPSGDRIKVWGVHPEPPVPKESLYSTAKDKELMKVALKVRECKLPCFVFGDLNDVAWSYTTELFRKTSNLLDPRRGRGFYATFSAQSMFIRFPLDYIFCSEHFGLIDMRRLNNNGSDHFATLTTIALNRQLAYEQETPEADKEELEQAKATARQPLKEE